MTDLPTVKAEKAVARRQRYAKKIRSHLERLAAKERRRQGAMSLADFDSGPVYYD